MSYDYTNYPLPPNWEQRFDRETKRFFFIDHFSKVTTWIDPRIELYNLDIQGSDLTNESDRSSMNSVDIEQHSLKEIDPRDKKVAGLQQKFPTFTLAKIQECLNANFDNISSVECILKRELQLIDQREKEESSKRMEENSKKLEKEIREKRIIDGLITQENPSDSNRKLNEIKLSSNKRSFEQEQTKTENNQQSESYEISNCMEFKQVTTNDNKEPRMVAENQTKCKQDTDGCKITISELQEESKNKSNRGPNRKNYQGSNTKNYTGHDGNLLQNRKLLAKGPNPANRIGPQKIVQVKTGNGCFLLLH